MSNFQPLEVVDRGSETQLQVVKNLNKLYWAGEGSTVFKSILNDFTHIMIYLLLLTFYQTKCCDLDGGISSYLLIIHNYICLCSINYIIKEKSGLHSN